MNFGGVTGNSRRMIPTAGRRGQNERDHDDLHLFRELHKREKERSASLLLPVSDEFEPSMTNNTSGNFHLYRISSSKKGSGSEFLAENNKHDYDWLKTPPATPLFPSLEMEAGAAELVVQKELPVNNFQSPSQPVQPPKATNSEAPKPSNGRPKSPPQKAKAPPTRSKTPSQRPSTLSMETKNIKIAHLAPNNLMNKRTSTINSNTSIKPTAQKDNNKEMLALNLSKSMSMGPNTNPHPNSNLKPRSRPTSPVVKSTIAAQIPEFSNETPPNLRTTERATSATRGRPIMNPTVVLAQKPTPITKPRRQSCSPSVTRGREVETNKQEGGHEVNLSLQKRRGRAGTGNGTNVLGSKMVEKMMNGRKSGNNEVEKDQTKSTKSKSLVNESFGFARGTPHGSISIDKSTLKEMVRRR